MKVYLSAVAVLVLAACASNTGIRPIGTGGYMVSKSDPLARHGGQVKADLMQEAEAFCTKQGKKFTPTESTSSDKIPYKPASAEVQFRCT